MGWLCRAVAARVVRRSQARRVELDHFVVGLNRSQRLEGTANPLPDETRQRPPKLSSAPGLVFELSGRTGVDSHPVRVAAWYLQQKGLDAGQIDGFEAQAVASGSGRSAPGSTVIVPTYRFRGYRR